MKFQTLALVLATGVAIVSGACSSGSVNPTGTGGTSGGGTSGGGTTGTGGSGASCPNVTACGGSVVGTWNVTSSCLKLSTTDLDISMAGLDPTACKMVQLDGSMTVSGSWTAKADGTFTDGTTTTGTVNAQFPAGCKMLSGAVIACSRLSVALEALGMSPATCTDAASGGGCTCTAMMQQQGTLGLPSPDPQMSGGYEIMSNTLATDSSPPARYDFCVSGSMLTMTPKSTNPLLTGTVVFQKGSSTGTGGTTGAGGSTAGSGGTSGAAGSTAGSGGTSGPGGSTAGSGGATGSGGRGGAGGSGTGTGGRGGAAGGAGGSAGSAGASGSAGTTGSGGSSAGRTDGPCDIYAAANMPCAAAYSMVRALSKSYTGFLYQVRSGSSAMNTGSGGMLKDIPMLPDGFADTATQDAFCSGTTCTVSLLYDHSGNGNNLPVAKKGLTNGGATAGMDDFESSATKGMMTIKGHKVYSLYMNAREGYRIMTKGKNVPLGSASQGIYELADGTHVGDPCCWDFGNVTTNPQSYADMNTLFFGKAFWGKGAGSGPWMMADFEGGVWAGGSRAGDPGWGALDNVGPANTNNPSLKVPFAFGLLKTSSSQWSLRMADMTAATSLTTAYQGAMPKPISNAGAVVLGVGGDNSNNSYGTFYEGAIVAGYPTDATDLAVFNNVKAVGYTR